MQVRNVIFDVNTFGITQRSLKMLRDTLARNADHRIAVAEVPTNDICCGFFIFDMDQEIVTWTGDGFRLDGHGEGGAGYRSANVLLRLYGVRIISWEAISSDDLYQQGEKKIRNCLLEKARRICLDLVENDFARPCDRMPFYI